MPPIGKNIIFIIDRSGSMSYPSSPFSRLDQAKEAFKEIIQTLNANDKFQVIIFDGTFESFFSEMTYATSDNINYRL